MFQSVLALILLFSLGAQAEDLGARYQETSPGHFQCILPSGQLGMNPNFLGECGTMLDIPDSMFENVAHNGLDADGSVWGAATSPRVSMQNSGFEGASLRGISMTHVRGEGPSFSHANLRRSRLTNVALTGAAFNSTNFSGSAFDFVTLDRAWAPRASFRGVNARFVSFRASYLAWADFERFDCDISCSFDGTYLWGADFKGADLARATFHAAFLRGAVFNRFTRLPFSHQEAVARGMIWSWN